MKMGTVVAALLAIAVVPASAQMGDKSMPMKDGLRSTYDSVKAWVTKAAEQVPEDQYAFKPTPEVRSFGQLFGHVANSNFMICSTAAGETSPSKANFENAKTKAEIVKAVADSFAYCDKVFDQMTEAKAHEMTELFGQKQPRLSVLAFNTAHDYEHYGNLVTYMRLKGMVPPSSQRSGM
jgi:uncharacterized damage-inducible protein DinB